MRGPVRRRLVRRERKRGTRESCSQRQSLTPSGKVAVLLSLVNAVTTKFAARRAETAAEPTLPEAPATATVLTVIGIAKFNVFIRKS